MTVVFLVFCVLGFGSLAVLSAESSSPNANITNASSALWWTYVTITTVGYGDRYPVTNVGRFVGVFVMTAGVGLTGSPSNVTWKPPSNVRERRGTAYLSEQAQPTIAPRPP